MSVDAAIKDVGLAATIVRAVGDVATYVYLKPKAKLANDFQFEAWLTTVSGVVNGDLVLYDGGYYLVANVVPDKRAGDFFKVGVVLYRCNNTISTRGYDKDSKKFIALVSDIPCLVIDTGMLQMSDKAVVLPVYTGRDSSYTVICQPNEIDRNSKLIDDTGISLSIAGEVNPYFVKGLVQFPVKIED